MRTLKKALSLVLVLAMVFALAVPGFAADKKASDFTDYSKVTNKEAVDVLTAIGVLNGNTDGSFGADGTFTRAQAATMLAYLTLGKTVADALPTAATNFNDVPATFWGAKYIQYCADAGYISGYGNGKFGPDDTLTSTQWALMLLGALGYKAANEGIGGNGWEIATTRLAMNAGVASAEDLTGTFNRDMAAKMAFNTLKADVVIYKTSGTSIIVGDTTINTGASAAEKITIAGENTDNYAGGSVGAAGLGTQQFCEAHFSTLKLDEGSPDKFGRTPDRAWYIDKDKDGIVDAGETVNTVFAAPVVTYTSATTAAQIAKDLKGYTLDGKKVEDTADKFGSEYSIPKANVTNTENGKTYNSMGESKGKTASQTLEALTANGKVVEIYADAKTKAITAVVRVAYTVETISNITTNSKTGDVTYDFSVTADKVDYADAAKTDTVTVVGTVAKGDVVTTVTAGGMTYVYPTTKVTGVQNSKTSANVVSISGTNYTIGTGVAGVSADNFNNSTKEANYYVDQNGFVVKTDSIATAASTDYVYVTAVDQKVTSSFGAQSSVLKVKALTSAGEVGEYTVKVESVTAENVATINARTVGTDTVAAGDIVLDGTKVCVYDASASTTKDIADTVLKDKVFGYTTDENGLLKLELVDTASSSMTKGTAYTESLDAQAITGTKTGTYTLLTENTQYVVYNSTTKKVSTYTGSAVKADLKEVTGAAVVVATSASAGTASVVFATSSAAADATNVEVVFLKDASSYTTVLAADGKTPNYQYTAYKADGTEVTLTATATTNIAQGLYVLNSKATISDEPINCSTDKDEYVYNTSVTVEAGMLHVGDTYYTYGSAKVLDLTAEGASLGESGVKAYIILNKVGGTVTSDALSVFIVD